MIPYADFLYFGILLYIALPTLLDLVPDGLNLPHKNPELEKK